MFFIKQTDKSRAYNQSVKPSMMEFIKYYCKMYENNDEIGILLLEGGTNLFSNFIGNSCNKRFLDLIGLRLEDIEKVNIDEIISSFYTDDETINMLKLKIEEALYKGNPVYYNDFIIRKSSVVTHCYVEIVPVYYVKDSIFLVIKLIDKVENMQINSNVFQSIFDIYPNPTAYTNSTGDIINSNRAFNAMFKKYLDTGKKISIYNIISIDYPKSVRESIFQKLKRGIPHKIEGIEIKLDGKIIDISVDLVPVYYSNKENGILFVCSDVTEKKKMMSEITHQAFHDYLTDLPNRFLFIERLKNNIFRAQRNNEYRYALVYLDLDDFKIINDSLGHLIGDQLLQKVAERLLHAIRSDELVSRLGGDEFAIILEKINNYGVKKAVKRIQEIFDKPFDIGTYTLNIGASIGVIVDPKSERVEEVLKEADIAMYSAKKKGKNTVVKFNDHIKYKLGNRIQLIQELDDAVSKEEFGVYYQLIYDMDKSMPVGIEALMRWDHPRLGIIAPNTFLMIAQETGLIIVIGYLIIEKAIKEFSELYNRHDIMHGIFLSINISSEQFYDADFVPFLLKMIKKYDVAADRIKIEVSEETLMKKSEKSLVIVEKLHEIGVVVSVDDFGTGFFSFSYIYKYKINSIKIDKSFIKNINQDKGEEIIKSMISIGKILGIDVVAEGIESKKNKEQLFNMGCNLGQGYFYSKPMPVSELEVCLCKSIQRYNIGN